MSIDALAKVERLRPAKMQCKPVRMAQVFADPDEAIRRLHAGAPYRTLAAYHEMESTYGDQACFPWFRESLADEYFLKNPAFLAAARQAFSAAIVRPTACLVNLNGPMRAGTIHLDLPRYRGFGPDHVPNWLLLNMTYSGLFHAWMVPIAAGLVWFYRGEGGAYQYWPDGPEEPSAQEKSPLWNSGLMSDNNFMWHRVAAIGSPPEQARVAADLRTSDRMHRAGDGWEIRDGARAVHRLANDQVRISILWIAQVFSDADHLASFEDPRMDLDLNQVVELYLDDLSRRGVAAQRPADPLHAEWRNLLESVYPAPFLERPGT